MSGQLITPEFRQKCLQKIQALHSKLGILESPENLEQKCYDKSQKKYEEYIKIIQILLCRSKMRGIPTAAVPAGSSSTAMASLATTSRGHPSTTDPLHALHNLTGSAGQAVAPSAARLNPTVNGGPIRPRSLIQGTINRPIDRMCNSNPQSVQQLGVAKIPMNVVISNANVANIRMVNSPLTIKTDVGVSQSGGPQSVMAPPYQVESYNIPLMNSPQNIQKSVTGKPCSYNTMGVSQFGCLKDQLMTSQPSSVVTSINNPHLPANTAQSTLNATPNLRSQAHISEEESKRVKEEIGRLKERFIQKLSMILESPKTCSDEEIRIWSALKNLLENPDSISKPLSMRNVLKIEQHLLKVDQHLISKLSKSQSAEGTTKPAPISLNNKNLQSHRNESAKLGPNYEKSLIKTYHVLPNGSGDNSKKSTVAKLKLSSLDIAFDDVCHQLQRADKTVVNQVQHNLIQYIKSRQPLYQHFLPKRAFDDENEANIAQESQPKRVKVESIVNEVSVSPLDHSLPELQTEFDLVECPDKEHPRTYLSKEARSAIDEHGLLRIDLNMGCVDADMYNMAEELHILQSEFQVSKLEAQKYSEDWFSYDSNWEGSHFYSVAYQNQQNLPSCVPPITLRMAADYDDSGYTDWNLNLGLYLAPLDLFLSELANTLSVNFTDAHLNYQWAGIPILHVISLYKRSIVHVCTNLDHRNRTSSIEVKP